MVGQGGSQQARQPSSAAVKRGRPSGPSRTPAFVQFVNKTSKNVDVFWVNYEGLRVKYRTLEPSQPLNVNTFVGHRWIFKDSATGERMVVNFKSEYEPPAWYNKDTWPPLRNVANITLPVFTLLERSLQVVRSLVPRDSIKELNIPNTLHAALLCPAVDISVASSAPCSIQQHQQQQQQDNG